MTVGLRGKLFAASVLLIGCVGLASGLFLEAQLRDWIVDGIEDDVLSHAKSARVLVEESAPSLSPRDVDPIADRMGQTTGSRITIVDADGDVLGDSSLDLRHVKRVENHANRPEIRSALRSTRGTARRYSETLDREMLYVAVPFPDDAAGAPAGVVRASVPLEQVGANVRRLRIFLAAAALLGLAVAIFMSGLASHLAARNLRSVVTRARDKFVPEPATDDALEFDPEEETSIEAISEKLGRAVDQLARQRDRLEAILESMNEAVVVVDQDRSIELVNSAAADLFRLTADPTGRRLSAIVDDPALESLHDEASAGEQSTTELAIERGETIYLDARASREPTTGSVVIVMHDVTDLRRLEQMRREFVANVSHELRTPVSLVRANAETLRDGALDDPEHAPRFLDSLLGATERMDALIDDLLEISRLEAGAYDFEPEIVPVRPAVDRAFDDLHRRADERRIDCTNNVDADVEVLADRQALDQILRNLVENAVKYTQEGGSVWIRAHGSDEAITIDIKDNGPGIPESDRDRIFERFYRVDDGRSREQGGTGLGLAIVERLVHQMNGEIAYRPGKARGSVFVVTLPAPDS